jgi:AraC-like DNA-binding protein
MSDDPGIAFAIVDPVLHALAELGYDADEHRHAVAGAAMVGGSRVDALLDLAAAELADSTLALSLAPRIPIGRLGDLDYALCTSSTLRDGLGRLERFYGVLTQRVKLSLVESPPQAALRLRRREGITHSRHWIEFSFAMIAERIRQILARDVQFREVTFRHAAPPSRSAYDAFFGTTVRFGAAEDRMGFASDLLDNELTTASKTLAEVLDARMHQVQRTVDARGSAAGRVRLAIGELLEHGEAGLPATASRLRTTTRTLQRALKKEGASHQRLLDEARRERAQQLLASGLSMREVAKRLGFSEASAFFRAFRRWTGTSPRARR